MESNYGGRSALTLPPNSGLFELDILDCQSRICPTPMERGGMRKYGPSSGYSSRWLAVAPLARIFSAYLSTQSLRNSLSGRLVSNCRTVSCHLSKKVKRPREAKVSAMSSIEVCRSPMNLRSKVSTSRT